MTPEHQESKTAGEFPGVAIAHVDGNNPTVKGLIRKGELVVLKIFRIPKTRDWSMVVMPKKEAALMGLVGVSALLAIGLYKLLKHKEKRAIKRGK